MIDEIQDLFAYNRWANRRLLDATATLEPESFTRELGSSFPSVQATLAHVLTVEWVWLRRWQGSSPTSSPSEWDLATADGLRREWSAVDREQEDFLAGLKDGALASQIDYRNVAGEPFRAPLWQLLRHVVNHSTFHRGQVVTMLRQLGAVDVPATDLVLFYRERAASQAAPET